MCDVHPSGYALLFLLPLAACSSATAAEVDGCTEGTPLVTATSQSGALSVAVCTSSQPPVEDQMQGEVTVRDATTKSPVDGLTLSVTPWMPAMGHGQSVTVTVTPKGNGVYAIAPLAFFMAGEWELVTKIEGPMSDTANPAFYVP
jgi:hypothetical protein